MMNYEGIAALLYDAWRASLTRKRLLRKGPVPEVSLLTTPALVKESRLPAFDALSGDERLHWIDLAKVAHEVIAAAVLAFE